MNTNNNTKKTFTKIGFLMVIATFLLNGVQILAMTIAGSQEKIVESPTLSFLAAMVPIYIIAYPLIFVFFRKVPAETFEEKKLLTFPKWLQAFCIGYMFIFAGSMLASIFVWIIGFLKQAPVNNGLVNITTTVNPVLNFVVMCVCAPIAEELLFRKTLMDRTLKYGEKLAVVFSAVLFGLFHGNLQQFLYTTCLGLFFAFVYAKTKNVLNTILLHVCINIPGTIIAPYIMKKSGLMEFMSQLSGDLSQEKMMNLMTENMSGFVLLGCYELVLFVILVLGLVFLILNRKKITFASGNEPLEKGTAFRIAFLNIGVLLYIFLCSALIILQLM